MTKEADGGTSSEREKIMETTRNVGLNLPIFSSLSDYLSGKRGQKLASHLKGCKGAIGQGAGMEGQADIRSAVSCSPM